MTADRLDICRPDDWHVHLRDGATLASVVGHTARRFGRAIVMPNLKPPVTNVAQAEDYRRRILASLPTGTHFQPLMTLYLTEATPVQEIQRAKASGSVFAVKYYPAGATTNSQDGVRDLEHVNSVLEAMQRHDLPLLLHGEVTDPAIDIFDRERVFIERELAAIVRDFPGLRVVLEHITTSEAVDFVTGAGANVAATITPQHLVHSRNALFDGGLRPHLYCLPLLKREAHRRALVAAATSGHSRFFLGTDSAPHARDAKERDCGCAGCYGAPAAMALYAQVFDDAGALDRLEGFASHHGADFYRLPRNGERITLVRERWRVPESLPLGDATIVPLGAGEELRWRVAEERGEE